MDADLDTLATALYVRVDDLLKSEPGRSPCRPRVGITPKISDAEMLTLSVMQALLGHSSESRWLRFAHASLRALFPYLPQQPGYSKRLRALAATMNWLIGVLARDTSLWTADVWVVDSTPVECARSRETVRRSDLAGWAEYGYCASHSRYFWGLRLHLLCTLHGLPVGFALTGAKADERQVLLDIVHADPDLSDRPAQIMIGDKNYYGAEFEAIRPPGLGNGRLDDRGGGDEQRAGRHRRDVNRGSGRLHVGFPEFHVRAGLRQRPSPRAQGQGDQDDSGPRRPAQRQARPDAGHVPRSRHGHSQAVDYVAGMTDRFAGSAHARLC